MWEIKDVVRALQKSNLSENDFLTRLHTVPNFQTIGDSLVQFSVNALDMVRLVDFCDKDPRKVQSRCSWLIMR